MQERSEAERRAIWPCLNVATWRRIPKASNIQSVEILQAIHRAEK